MDLGEVEENRGSILVLVVLTSVRTLVRTEPTGSDQGSVPQGDNRNSISITPRNFSVRRISSRISSTTTRSKIYSLTDFLKTFPANRAILPHRPANTDSHAADLSSEIRSSSSDLQAGEYSTTSRRWTRFSSHFSHPVHAESPEYTFRLRG